MRTRRFCHGRPDVSERERRLLLRGETPGYGPGRGPESGGFTERYDAPPTRDGFGRKSFMIPLQSKLHADAWHEQLAMHKGQPGGDALLRVYAEKMSRGEPYPWIRTMGDAKLAEFKLIHGQNGTLVESGMTSAYASNTRENAEEERAWREGRGLEYTREKNARKAAGFRQRSAFDVSRAPTPENPANVAERERRGAVQEAMYARWTRAENLRKEMRRALYDATKEGGGDSYWGRLLRKFDAEMDKIRAGKPSLVHGLQSNEQFDAWIAEHNAYLDPVESSLREWQSVLLQPVGTVNVLNEAEMGELLKHYDRTQVLFANYAQSRFVAEEVLQGDAPIEQKRSLVLKAVADLNAFGSHLYKYYAGQKVLPGQIDAYMQGVQRYLDANGKLKNGDLVTITAITADEAGIQELLKIRTELLSSLQVQAFEKDKRTLGDLEAHVVASRREVEYLERTNSKNERYDEVKDNLPNISVNLAQEYKKATDAIDMADADKKLAAANRECLFLMAYFPDDARTKELFNRSNDSPGIIQRQYELLHKPLRDATNAAADPATPEQFRARLQAIKTEGRFLRKHVDLMAQSAEARLSELFEMQEKDTLGLIDATVNGINRKDPVAVGNAIVDIAETYVRPLENSVRSKNTAGVARAKLEPLALGLRALVNPLVAEARTSADADPSVNAARIDAALSAADAEMRALGSLSLDQARVASLSADLRLIDKRVDQRVAAEKSLDATPTSTPTVDSFRKAYGLLRGEERAVRIAYGKDPDALKARLATIDQRRDAYAAKIHEAAAYAIGRLGKESKKEDVASAEGLLRLSLQLSTGINNPNAPLIEIAKHLPDSTGYQKAAESIAKIDAARATAVSTPDAEPARKAAADKKPAEAPKSELGTPNVASDVRLTPGVAELIRDFPDFQWLLADLRQAYGGVEFVSYDQVTKRCTIKLPENGNDRLDAKGALRSFGYFWSPEDVNEERTTITLTLSKISDNDVDNGKAGRLKEFDGASLRVEFREFKDMLRHVNGNDAKRRLEGRIQLFNRKLQQMYKGAFESFAEETFGQGPIETRRYTISLDRDTRTISVQLKASSESSTEAPKSEPQTRGIAPAADIETKGATSKGVTESPTPKVETPKSEPAASAESAAKPMELPPVVAADAAKPVAEQLPSRSGVEALVKDALFSLRQNDAYLTALEEQERAGTPVDEKAVTLELAKRLDALVDASDRMADVRRRLVDADREGDANPLHRFDDAYLAAREALLKRLQHAHEKIGTAESITEAARIFHGRYMQHAVETRENARKMFDKEQSTPDSGADATELRAELMGDGTPQNPGLLAKAVAANVDERLIDDLRAIEKNSRPFSS